MSSRTRELRRRQLDRQLGQLASPAPPNCGWIRAIREALGMSLDALGSHLGVSRQAAHQLEKSEESDTVTLKKLRAAAEALDCELVVYLAPKNSLEATIQSRARAVAAQEVMRTYHSMGLESQAVSEEEFEEQIAERTRDLVQRGDPKIWA